MTTYPSCSDCIHIRKRWFRQSECKATPFMVSGKVYYMTAEKTRLDESRCGAVGRRFVAKGE